MKVACECFQTTWSLYCEMRTALLFFLASVCWHADYLNSTLSPKHKIFQSVLFRDKNMLDWLRGELCYESRCSHLSCTGIPAHVDILDRLKKLEEKFDNKLVKDIGEEMESVIERRGVAAGNVTVTLLENSINKILDARGLDANMMSGLQTNETMADVAVRETHNWGGTFHLLPESFVLPKVGRVVVVLLLSTAPYSPLSY